MKHTLLIIDDEIDNLDALERIFRKNYILLKASSGREALAHLANHKEISVIVCDQRMPEMTGVEVLEKSITTHPDTVRILLTGYTDIESIITAVNQGNIFRYLTKPWDPTDLANSIVQATQKYDLLQAIKNKNKELEVAYTNLQKLDEAKSKFMILINHELKTPLTVIINYLDLIKEQLTSQDLLTLIEKPIASSQRLQTIVENSLIIMKAQTDQLETTNQKVNLNSTIKEIIAIIKDKYDSELKKKKLTFNLNEINNKDSFFILIHEVYLKKILDELIKNAIQYASNDTEIQLKINKHAIENKVKFEIINKGNPISSEVKLQLITPFKLPANIMNHSKGIGLGLSVCETLLLKFNSNLNIEDSSQNKDEVRIHFSLPNTN